MRYAGIDEATPDLARWFERCSLAVAVRVSGADLALRPIEPRPREEPRRAPAVVFGLLIGAIGGAGPISPTLFGRGAGEGLGVHICTGPVALRLSVPALMVTWPPLSIVSCVPDFSLRLAPLPRHSTRARGT